MKSRKLQEYRTLYAHRAILLSFVIIGLTLLALPLEDRWLIPCPFHQLTGWDCPFCGTQRMIRALLQGDWALAFTHNPFVMCSIPIWMLVFIRYLFPNSRKLHTPLLAKLLNEKTLLIYLIIAILWGILRNSLSLFTHI